MEEIRIVLTIRKCKNNVDAEGEIHTEVYAGDKHYGRVYPYGGKFPSSDQIFQIAVVEMRKFMDGPDFIIPASPVT